MTQYTPENPTDPEKEFEAIARALQTLGLDNFYGERVTVIPNINSQGNAIPLTPIVISHSLGVVPDDYYVIGDKTIGIRYDPQRPPTQDTVTFEFTTIHSDPVDVLIRPSLL